MDHVAQKDKDHFAEHLRHLRPWAKDVVMGWERGSASYPIQPRINYRDPPKDTSMLTSTPGAFGFPDG